MSELSNFLEDKFLDITLKGGTAYNVTTAHLALFSSDPTDAVVGADVTVTHIGIYDAATSGNLMYHTALDASKTLSAADVMSVAASGVSVTLS